MIASAAQRVADDPLQCHIVPARGTAEGSFTVEVRGVIPGAGRPLETTVTLSALDITEGSDRGLRVLQPSHGSDPANEREFSHQGPLGPVGPSGTRLAQWTPVARLDRAWFRLARRGPRCLRVTLAVRTSADQHELARVHCLWECQNTEEGYLDAREKEARARLWALPLAFALAGTHARPCRAQFHLIARWIMPGLDPRDFSLWTRLAFGWALWSLSRATRRMSECRLRQLCAGIVGVASPSGRCDILKLCLAVCAARERVPKEAIALLWRFGEWLEMDPQRVRHLMDKALPIHRHAMGDPSGLLGLSPALAPEEALLQLNREYAKWNARVTHADRSIRRQAAQMLDLIARVRGHYVA